MRIDELLEEIAGRIPASRREGLTEDSPILSVTVAAELAGMHAQTLRQYDRLGLVVPARTAGNVRRYSLRNIAELDEIGQLIADGHNVQGIAQIMALREEVRLLKRQVRGLEDELAETRRRAEGSRVFAATPGGAVQSMERGRRAPRRSELVLWRSPLM